MKIGRAYMKGQEFEERQGCLPFFGRVTRMVLPIIVKLRRDLRAWEKPARVARAKLADWCLPLPLPQPGKFNKWFWKTATQSSLSFEHGQ